MKKRTFIEAITIIIVAGFIMFFNLGGIPLLDPDEPVYAETAQEMIISNDFISPRIYGDFWYDKPPMYYWLVAGAFKVFGQSEFAARVPSAILAVGGALVVYYFGKTILNSRAAFIAALVLATSIEYLYLGKAAVTDITLTFFLTVTMLAYLRGHYYLAYVGAALAVVTKGPIGIVFPAGIIFIHLFLTRNLSALRNAKVFQGGLLFLAVALPWYLAMYFYHGADFINTFLGFHNVTRFLQPEHSSGTLWYYYIPVLLIGFFPWMGLLVQACYAAWQNKKEPQGSFLTFFLVWAVVVFGFFSASQTKLVSYILPMYPPLALIVGWYIDKIMSEKNKGAFSKASVFVTILTVVLVIALFFAGKNMPKIFMTGVTASAVVFLTMLGGMWLTAFRGNGRGFITALVSGMVGFVIILMTWLFPAAAPLFSVKDFSVTFREHYDGQAPVYIEKFYRPGFTFYTGIAGKEIKDSQQIEKAVLENYDRNFIVISKKRFEKLPVSLKNRLQVKASQDDKVLLIKESD